MTVVNDYFFSMNYIIEKIIVYHVLLEIKMESTRASGAEVN